MYNNVLLPVDPESAPVSTKAIKTASRIAWECGAQHHIIAVVQGFGGYASSMFPKDFTEKAVALVREKLKTICGSVDLAPDRIHRHALVGAIYEEIITLARKLDVDLIVMASHRPELSDYLFSPNAARVVRHSDCSVLVVRPKTGEEKR